MREQIVNKMSEHSENSYQERDQFEEVEHVVTIEKKVPEGGSQIVVQNQRGIIYNSTF